MFGQGRRHRGGEDSRGGHSKLSGQESKNHLKQIHSCIQDADAAFQKSKYQFCTTNYEKALQLFDEIQVEQDELHVLLHCLMQSSRSKLMIGEGDGALKDAARAIALSSDNARCFNAHCEAMYLKAEAYFHTGDFETALMFYHRGIHLAPVDDAEFRHGVTKCADAIQKTIDSIHPDKLKEWHRDHVKEEIRQKRKMEKEARRIEASKMQNRLANVSVIKPDIVLQKNTCELGKTAASSLNSLSQSKNSLKKTRKPHNYLDELQEDKEFLQDLYADGVMQGGRMDDVHELVEAALGYLKTREDFWRQREFQIDV